MVLHDLLTVIRPFQHIDVINAKSRNLLFSGYRGSVPDSLVSFDVLQVDPAGYVLTVFVLEHLPY